MRELVFDTETTGLNANEDRLVSIALVELLRKVPTGRFLHFYLNPDRESSPGAFKVHGLTTEFLSTKPRFKDVIASVLDFIAGAPLVIHNGPFDMGFLNAELHRIGRNRYAGRYHCTLCDARRKFPGQRGHRLDDLTARFQLKNLRELTGKHGALVDCLQLVNVYRKLEGLPVVDFDLAPFMTDGNETEQTSTGSGLPQSKEPDATPAPVDAGQGVSRTEQVPVGDAGVHHATAPVVPESASPATGDHTRGGEVRRVGTSPALVAGYTPTPEETP